MSTLAILTRLDGELSADRMANLSRKAYWGCGMPSKSFRSGVDFVDTRFCHTIEHDGHSRFSVASLDSPVVQLSKRKLETKPIISNLETRR